MTSALRGRGDGKKSKLIGCVSVIVKRGMGSRLFSVQNHSLSNLIHHEWMKHQLNNWFLLIPKTKLCCDTSHYFFQVDHLVGWIKRNQKDSIRIIFLSDFWVLMAFIHFFDSGIKRNQIFEWAVFTQLKTAYSSLMKRRQKNPMAAAAMDSRLSHPNNNVIPTLQITSR